MGFGFAPLTSIPYLLANAIQVLTILILIEVVISWAQCAGAARISSRNQFVNTVHRITDPLLNPVRRLIPPTKTGGLDLSPMIVIFVLNMIERMLVSM
jgi:YggT family protein